MAQVRGWTHHAEHRAWERYGIVATPDEWNTLLLDILNAVAGITPVRALMLRRDRERELWAVKLGPTAVVVAYSPHSAKILTVVEFDRHLQERHSLRHTQRRHMPRRRERADRYRKQWSDE